MTAVLKPGQCPAPLRRAVERQVAAALEEEGGADLSTAAVVEHVKASAGMSGETSAKTSAKTSARVVSREAGILAGVFWFDEVFAQVDPAVAIRWRLRDGDAIEKGMVLCTLSGDAASLLRGERCALNFLQTLSGAATTTAEFVARSGGVTVKDTRKTLPGLRLAQKYAVVCGGGVNHRLGLADAVLLKDNHVRACGSVGATVAAARRANPGLAIEVEVSTLEEVREALAAGADTIMLDNFELDAIHEAVGIIAGKAQIEVSGGVGLNDVARLADAGIDCVSVGALTKHLHALDFSMQFD